MVIKLETYDYNLLSDNTPLFLMELTCVMMEIIVL